MYHHKKSIKFKVIPGQTKPSLTSGIETKISLNNGKKKFIKVHYEKEKFVKAKVKKFNVKALSEIL